MKKTRLIPMLALALMLLSAFHVCAEDTLENDPKYIKGRFYLEAVGVDVSDMTYDSEASRGFFADAVSKALFSNMPDIATQTGFPDVSPEHEYAASIWNLAQVGIINGDGTNFMPDQTITAYQAAKILVSSLGRDFIAQERGGYPFGYMAVASELNIMRGVDVEGDAALSFGQFAKIFLNFMDCQGYLLSYSNGTPSYSVDDSTVLDHKLASSDMTYVEGIVTGNQFGSLTGDELGRISIENVSYIIGCDIDADIIGCYVNAFVTEQSGGDAVTSIIIDPEENSSVTIAEDDIEEITFDSIRYYTGTRTETLRLNDVMVVRNGKILADFSQSDLMPVNGNITLIDNDDDGIYDVLQTENRQYFTVSRTSSSNNAIVLEDGSYEGSTHIYIDPEDSEYYHRIYFNDGTEASFSDIKSGDVLKFEGSRDQKILNVYIVNTTVNAAASSYSSTDNEIVIDGNTYKAAEDASHNSTIDFSQLRFGVEYIFTIDGDRVVKADDPQKTFAYGYVISAGTDQNTEQVWYRLVSDDKYIYKGDVADKIIYNGKSMDKSEFEPKTNIVIKYEIDDEGKICKIDDAELYSEKSRMTYSESTGIFYSQSYKYPLFMSDETVVFVVPNSGVMEDYMTDLSLVDGRTYDVEGYDYNEDDSSVSVVVIYDDFTYDTPGYITTDSTICIVKQISIALNEDGESVYQIDFLEGSREQSMQVKPSEAMNNIVANMAKGDVFQYSVTSRGLIDNINILVRLDQNPAYFHNGANSTVEQVYGMVNDVVYNTLPRGTAAKFVNMFTLDINDGSEPKNFLVTSDDEDVVYYYYDGINIRPASFEDVMSEDGALGTFNASDVFIYYCYREAKAVVINASNAH